MKITINTEWGTDVTLTLSHQSRICPGTHPDALLLVACPWDSMHLDIILGMAIDPDGTITHEWYADQKHANHYLHLDQSYVHHNNAVEVTDAMMETIAGLASGRIKIDGYHVAVGRSALDIVREEVSGVI